MPAAPLLSVVVPTRDEAANIGPLLARLASALSGVDHEVVVVDDSTDDTPRLVAAEAARRPGITLRHREEAQRSGGLSTAVLEGMRAARGEFVCVMDADLQHPPETVPRMLAAARDGADVVVASRYVRGGSHRGLDGAGRRLVSRGAGLVARALFTEARASSDPLSGFFVCRRRVIDGIEFRPVGFKILLELLVCVPGITVRDVPLHFEPRAAGTSKASLHQGVLFLRHVRSLFVDVQGSARRWKFGLVGLSGLAILLPLVAILTGVAGMSAIAAFLPAYLPSLAWNTVMNRRWTFADQRRGLGEGTARYLERAAFSGSAMLAAYVALLAVHLTAVPAALGAAIAAMAVNARANHAAVHRRPRLWSEVAASHGVQAVLRRLAAEIGADRAYVLPADLPAPGALPAGALERVVSTRRAALFCEATSHRAQRRSNIDMHSVLAVPLVCGDNVDGLLVCERTDRHPFDAGDLEMAMTAGPELSVLVGSGVGAERRRPALRAEPAEA